MDKFIQTIYDRFAGEGYAAVAPSLDHRITAAMLADGSRPADLLSSIDGERIGITGFCMGGRVAWLAAATNPHFKAAVPHYGGNIQCPILFHFGEIDANPSQEDMKKLGAELTRTGKEHQFYTYSGADHGFMDFTGARYHQEAAEAAWPRTLEFFAQHP